MAKKYVIFTTGSEKSRQFEQAGLPGLTPDEIIALEQNLPVHFGRFLAWFKNQPKKASEEMYCFILYDIEHNKIRRIFSKFLEKKGCIRVQKSVFFAKIHRKLFSEIKEIAQDLQQCYDNEDTIMLLPIGEDLLNNMHCIGKNFDFELLTQSKHTIIF